MSREFLDRLSSPQHLQVCCYVYVASFPGSFLIPLEKEPEYEASVCVLTKVVDWNYNYY